MRLVSTAALTLALAAGAANAALAKDATPHCKAGDPVVTVDMTSKTYMLDRPLATIPSADAASPSPEASGMASPEAMGSPMASAPAMAMGGSMKRMCESSAAMMGAKPATGMAPAQK